MITVDCPLCDGSATVDPALSAADCDGCGIHVDVAPDPEAASLDIAA